VYGVVQQADGVTYDKWSLVKVTTTNSNGELVPATILLHESSNYYGEMTFVPDPEGSNEDDGVLWSHVYDGIRRESYLLVLDARTMEPLAKAYSGFRGTIEFHGAFFPE